MTTPTIGVTFRLLWRHKMSRHVGKCHWCKRYMLHPNDVDTTKNGNLYRRGLVRSIDHILPKSDGGSYYVEACVACNCVKSNLSMKDWNFIRSFIPQWWCRFHQGKSHGHYAINDIAILKSVRIVSRTRKSSTQTKETNHDHPHPQHRDSYFQNAGAQ